MGMAEKWLHKDRLKENERKESNNDKSRRYYQKNSQKIKDRVAQNYQKIRLHLIELLGGKCVFCGQTNPNLLNLHHRVPMEIKSNKIYHYEKNTDILMLLCVKCHVTWHNCMDWLYIDDIFKDIWE